MLLLVWWNEHIEAIRFSVSRLAQRGLACGILLGDIRSTAHGGLPERGLHVVLLAILANITSATRTSYLA